MNKNGEMEYLRFHTKTSSRKESNGNGSRSFENGDIWKRSNGNVA